MSGMGGKNGGGVGWRGLVFSGSRRWWEEVKKGDVSEKEGGGGQRKVKARQGKNKI